MRWMLAGVSAVFGLMTIDVESLRWGMAGVLLFSLPLLLQWSNHKGLQVWALWGGIFLVVQSLLAPVVIDHDFKTLPPNMKQIVDVKGGIPGVNGWNFHIKKYFAKDTSNTQRKDNRDNFLLKNSLLGNFIINVDQSLKNKGDNTNQQGPTIRTDHGEYYSVQRNSLRRSTVFFLLPARC